MANSIVNYRFKFESNSFCSFWEFKI